MSEAQEKSIMKKRSVVEKEFESPLENAVPQWLYNYISKPFFRQTVEFVYNTVCVLFD